MNNDNNQNEGMSFTELYGVTSTDTTPTQPAQQAPAVEPTPTVQQSPESMQATPVEASTVDQPSNNNNNDVPPEFDTTIKIEEPKRINIMDSEYIRDFVGPKYDSFVNSPFNIGAFFLGNLYFFYRKMFAYGLIIFIIQAAIGMVTKIIGLGLLINVACAFVANKMYLNFAAKKVKSLSVLYSGMDLKQKCAEKGGTSIGLIFAGMAAELLCSLLIAIVSLFIFGAALFGSILNPNNWDVTINDSSTTDTGGNNAYDGSYEYDLDFRLADEYIYSKPSGLLGDDYPAEGVTDSGQFTFTYGSETNRKCTFEMGRVKNKTNAKIFAESYANMMNGIVGTKTINGIKWYSITSSPTDVIYFTDKDNQVYAFRYIAYEDNKECPKYRDQVLKTIKEK